MSGAGSNTLRCWISICREVRDEAEVAAYTALAALDDGAVRDTRIVPGV